MSKLAFFALAFAAAACSPQQFDTSTLETKLSSLESKISQLETTQLQVRSRVASIELAEMLRDNSKAQFDPQEAAGYSRIDTNVGTVLAVLDEVQPYLDGFVLKFQIGNPMFATFSGFKGPVE